MSDRLLRLAVALLIAVVPVACGGSATPTGAAAVVGPAGASAPIRTDRAEYVADRTGGGVALDIAIRFTNPTDGPTWLSTCHGTYPPAMEKLVGGSWVRAYEPPALFCLGIPIVVPAGGTHDEVFMVRASARGSNTYPQFELEQIPGTYRLVWEIYQGDGSELARLETPRLLPFEQRVSNTFTITER